MFELLENEEALLAGSTRFHERRPKTQICYPVSYHDYYLSGAEHQHLLLGGHRPHHGLLQWVDRGTSICFEISRHGRACWDPESWEHQVIHLENNEELRKNISHF